MIRILVLLALVLRLTVLPLRRGGLTRVLWLALLALGLWTAAAPAQALDEAGVPGGFSSVHDSPSPVPGGNTVVTGSGSQNDPDYLVLPDLPPGAQTITLTFEAPGGVFPGYVSGGEVRFKTSPFLHAWDGSRAGRFVVNFGQPLRTVTITLGAGFTGPLYIAIYFTHGQTVAYTIGAPSNAAPPAGGGSASPHLCGPPPAGAALLLESSLPGAGFSSQFNAPTPVQAQYDLIVGSGSVNAHDMLAISGLPSGAQTLTLTFCYPEGSPQNFWAGGNVLFRTAPFRWYWDGTEAGVFAVNPAQPVSTVTIPLGPEFGGTLYLALYFTYGAEIAWNLGLLAGGGPATEPEITASKTVLVHGLGAAGCASIPGQPGGTGLPAIPGACIEFRIDTANTGSATAEDLQIVDTLGSRFVFVSASATGFGGTPAPPVLTMPPAQADCAVASCEIRLQDAALDPGQSGRIVIRTLLK